MSGRSWLTIGATVAFLAVALGAMGAHWFEDRAKEMYDSPQLQAKRIHNWEVASQYQMYHALAVIAVGLVVQRQASQALSVAGWLFLVGAMLFCGSLYGIALCGVEDLKTLSYGVPLIAATPLGGVCFLAGWVAFAIGVWRAG